MTSSKEAEMREKAAQVADARRTAEWKRGNDLRAQVAEELAQAIRALPLSESGASSVSGGESAPSDIINTGAMLDALAVGGRVYAGRAGSFDLYVDRRIPPNELQFRTPDGRVVMRLVNFFPPSKHPAPEGEQR
jgi:hypothetical protein